MLILYIIKTTGFPSKRKGYILSQGGMDGICEVMKVARYFFPTLSMKSKWIKVSVIKFKYRDNLPLCERCKSSFFKLSCETLE